MLRRKDHYHNSRPVGYRVAKERSDVLFLIAHAIKHDPGQKNATGHNRESVAFKKRLMRFLLQSKLQIVHLIPALLVRRYCQVRSGLSAASHYFGCQFVLPCSRKPVHCCPTQRDLVHDGIRVYLCQPANRVRFSRRNLMLAFPSRTMFLLALAAVAHGQGTKHNAPAMDDANQLYSAKNWSA